MSRRVEWILVVLCAVAFGAGSAGAACPSREELLELIPRLGLERGARTARYGAPVPLELYEKAAKKAGQPVVDRQGNTGQCVMVAELPVERVWMAINDEEHHALDDYVPVRYSAVVGGTPRGESRLLFQYYEQLGIGRWWVSRVRFNPDLYDSSDGRLWELVWHDEMDGVDPDAEPFSRASHDMPPIRSTEGAWLLTPVSDDCTLVEQFTRSDPGGAVGLAQRLTMGRALRQTVSGLVRMAEEHVTAPHPGATFLRPDGTPIDAANARRAAGNAK